MIYKKVFLVNNRVMPVEFGYPPKKSFFIILEIFNDKIHKTIDPVILRYQYRARINSPMVDFIEESNGIRRSEVLQNLILIGGYLHHLDLFH